MGRGEAGKPYVQLGHTQAPMLFFFYSPSLSHKFVPMHHLVPFSTLQFKACLQAAPVTVSAAQGVPPARQLLHALPQHFDEPLLLLWQTQRAQPCLCLGHCWCSLPMIPQLVAPSHPGHASACPWLPLSFPPRLPIPCQVMVEIKPQLEDFITLGTEVQSSTTATSIGHHEGGKRLSWHPTGKDKASSALQQTARDCIKGCISSFFLPYQRGN